MTASVVTYAVIGLCVGLYAATRELDLKGDRLDIVEPGAVAVFAAFFWPIVVVVVALGVTAHWLARVIFHGGGR